MLLTSLAELYRGFRCTAETWVSQKQQKECPNDAAIDTMQLAYKLLGYTGASPQPRIQWCSEPAPENPNVWTDGSYQHPGMQLAFGSFGSWEPGRDCAQLSSVERDFSQPVDDANPHRPTGILLAGILPGVYNSSTRNELAGFIANATKPGGFHYGIDKSAS